MTYSKELVSKQAPIFETTPQWVGLLHEVSQLRTHQQKTELLTHQLNAIMKEHLGIPFHSYAMVGSVGFKELHDNIYLSSNVLTRCQNAIDAAKDMSHKTRYEREKEQVEKLLELLQTEFSEFALPALNLICSQKEIPIPFPGWKSTNDLLSPEVSWQLNVPRDTPCFVGKKYFSIMPQSCVHKGWKSMYLICQPAYLPEYDTWVVLQDQHMLEAGWQDQHELLSQLDPSYIPPSDETPLDVQKLLIMRQYVELDSCYQQLSAQDTFVQLLYKCNRNIVEQRQIKLDEFNSIAKTFPLHVKFLIDTLTLDDELSHNEAWSDATSEQVSQSMEKSLRTLLLKKETITSKNVATWLKEYKEVYQSRHRRKDPWAARSLHQILSVQSAQWLSLPIASQLECMTVSFGKMTNVFKTPQILNAIKRNSLSGIEIERIVGRERFNSWHDGFCWMCNPRRLKPKCLVGECDVCLACEVGLGDVNTTKNDLKKNDRGNEREKMKSTYSKKDRTSITLTQFIAGDFTNSHSLFNTLAA